ncbi:MAG TPA: hypothetical protein VNT51_02890, partial [Miltoncostaeaceae bacterium]|nr:hypothetical protein [Miltoncostaeaceae bacterium]
AEVLLVVVGYLLVAVHATWPLARHPFSGFYGFGNDNLGGVWVYGALHDAYWGPGSTARSPDLQAPFGYPMPDQVLQPMDRLYSLLFGGLGQGLGAYNVQIFLSFVLAGCTMYAFARYLTGNPWAAAVAGLLYTYSPWHLALAMQYNSLAAIEWIPLFLLALTVLLRRGRLRDAALAGAAFALVAATSYYYAWFVLWASLIVGVVFALRLALRRRREAGLTGRDVAAFTRLAATRVGLGALVALAILVPLLLPSLQASRDPTVAAQVAHPVEEAARYSLRPWMLVLPPHDHPLVDGAVERAVLTHLYDMPVYEQAVYLGYVALLLAALGLWRTRGRWLAPPSAAARFARPLLVTAALAGLVMMLGPYVPLETGYWRQWADIEDTRRLPSLGLLMFEVAPNFRFFVRAFVVVSVCLAALAAIGFARVERRLGGSPRRGAALAALVGALVLFEYANAPPRVFAHERTPPWVTAVRGLPGDGAIVNYPQAPLSSPRSLYYIFWQRRHGRPTLNPAIRPEALELAAATAAPDDPASGRALHAAGIRYAVVHTDLPPQTRPPYQPQLPDDSLPADAGANNPWFEPLRRTPDAVVYRVRSSPRAGGGAAARTGAGFGAPEPEAGTTAQWLEGEEGVIQVFGARGRPLRLTLTLASYGAPRRAEFRRDGRLLRRVRVGGYRRVGLDLGRLPAGTHALTVRAVPGPQPIGGGDVRSVSLRVRDLDVKEVAP